MSTGTWSSFTGTETPIPMWIVVLDIGTFASDATFDGSVTIGGNLTVGGVEIVGSISANAIVWNGQTIPTPPLTGTVTLQSVNGVLQWV